MKGSVRRLQLHRKIILVARDAREFCAFPCGHKHGSCLRIQVLIGIGDGASNVLNRGFRCIGGKVSSKKAAGPVDHVTLRAARLADEKRLAPLCVARNGTSLVSSLQNSQVIHDRFDFLCSQRAKRGHSRRGYSGSHDMPRFLVSKLLNLGASGDVWPALASPPVQPVAGSTNGFKRFPAASCGRALSQTLAQWRSRSLRSAMNRKWASGNKYRDSSEA